MISIKADFLSLGKYGWYGRDQQCLYLVDPSVFDLSSCTLLGPSGEERALYLSKNGQDIYQVQGIKEWRTLKGCAKVKLVGQAALVHRIGDSLLFMQRSITESLTPARPIPLVDMGIKSVVLGCIEERLKVQLSDWRGIMLIVYPHDERFSFGGARIFLKTSDLPSYLIQRRGDDLWMVYEEKELNLCIPGAFGKWGSATESHMTWYWDNEYKISLKQLCVNYQERTTIVGDDRGLAFLTDCLD